MSPISALKTKLASRVIRPNNTYTQILIHTFDFKSQSYGIIYGGDLNMILWECYGDHRHLYEDDNADKFDKLFDSMKKIILKHASLEEWSHSLRYVRNMDIWRNRDNEISVDSLVDGMLKVEVSV